jgi:hypothetical protein
MSRRVKGFFTAAGVALMSLTSHALEIGAQAPDFIGASNHGPIRLSDLRGKNVVLAFYFADFTPV